MVHVKWHDSRTISRTWEDRHEALKYARKPGLIDSVGILIEDNDNDIVIALDYDRQQDMVNSSASIPKTAIRKLRNLGNI